MTSPFPTAYMPPLSYFALLLKSDVLEIEAHETYPKQSWRNRCSIATAQGVLDLTVPVVKPYGNRTQTKETLIDAKQKWQNNHWRAIESAYNKSPYFLYFQDKLKTLIYSKQVPLLEFNNALMRFFMDFFKIKKELRFSENYQKIEPQHDLRILLHPKAKPLIPLDKLPIYYQVFSDNLPFFPNLSILDLAANEGPSGIFYLEKVAELSF